MPNPCLLGGSGLDEEGGVVGHQEGHGVPLVGLEGHQAQVLVEGVGGGGEGPEGGHRHGERLQEGLLEVQADGHCGVIHHLQKHE